MRSMKYKNLRGRRGRKVDKILSIKEELLIHLEICKYFGRLKKKKKKSTNFCVIKMIICENYFIFVPLRA